MILLIQYHKSFDNHHKEPESLYRIISDLELGNNQETFHMATCSPPIAPAMQEDFPEVTLFTRACQHPGLDEHLLRVDDKVFYEKKGIYVDSTFFRMFRYNFLHGDAENALDQPNTVVLSKKLALKLFDNVSVIGKTVMIGGDNAESPFKVTGVYDNKLGNAHLSPSFFIAMNSVGIGQYIRTNNSWAGNNFIYGYVKLQSGTDVKGVEEKLSDFLLAHGGDQLRDIGMKKELHLQPVSQIHTNTELEGDIATNISGSFLTILMIIAGFIQLVACINFMNLTTARSSKRAQEVGIRKTVGAPRSSLVNQFLGESIIITAIAMILAIPLVKYLLPFINAIIGIETSFAGFSNTNNLILVIAIILFTGLLAGSYPAFYLSSFKPLSIMRNSQMSNHRRFSGSLRKGLVVGQFTLAIVLVIGALTIRAQLKFMESKDLGFEKAQKVVFPFSSQESKNRLEVFRNEVLRISEVQSVSAMSQIPGQPILMDIPMHREGEDMNSAIDIRTIYADEDYFETLKIDILSGRSLTTSDTSTVALQVRVVLNETAAKQLGLDVREAPGTDLFCEFEGVNIRAQVVGVMQDILYGNLASEVRPFMVIAEARQRLSFLVADVSTSDYSSFLQIAENGWNEILPGIPFEYSFLDATIDAQYHAEQSLSKIITIFTYISIFISCLGLFGLSVFAAERRMKEIGIRKVLGASITGIVAMLTKDFLKLVLIALIIASPVAFFLLENWLNNFAHRTQLSWGIFVTAGTTALALTFLTIIFQSLRAALHNPIYSLKDE